MRRELDRIQADLIATRAATRELERLPNSEPEVRDALLWAIRAAVRREAPDQHFGVYCVHGAEPGEFHRGETRLVREGEIGFGGFNLAAFIAHQAYAEGEETVADRYLARLKAEGKVGKMAKSERTARLEKLRAKLVDLQVAEELAILELEKDGHLVLRRRDADPAVLLEVWGERDSNSSETAAHDPADA